MKTLIHGLLALLALAPGLSSAAEDPPPTTPAPSINAREAAEEIAPSTPEEVSTTVEDPRIQKWADRFKGSVLVFDQSISPETFPGAQLTTQPSYQWWFSLRPRYNFTPELSLSVRLGLLMEWANSAETTYYREAQLLDTWVDLGYTGIPKFGGIATALGLRVILPTSKPSQAQSNILYLAASAGLNRNFETRGGDFDIGLSGSIGHTFVGQSTPGLTGGLAYQCQTTDFSHQQCEQVSGRENPYLQVSAALALKYSPIKRLSIGASYILLNAWRNQVPDTTLTSLTGGVTTIDGSSPTDTRQSTSGWFLASVDFEVVKWLGLSLGYYTFRPVFDENINGGGNDPGHSGIGNPFWKAGGASRIFFSININLDAVYQSAATRAARNRSSVAAATMPQQGNTAFGLAPSRF